MKIASLKVLVDQINNDLGGFCVEFALKRKELGQLRRCSNRNILFKYDENSGRDWAINEGGGSEIQYHIYWREDEVGYGLGFNAQYVPFANEKTPVDYIKPFADAFLVLLKKNKEDWINRCHFDWLEQDEDRLKNIQKDNYVLFGKRISFKNGEIADKDYHLMIEDIKGPLYTIYQQVFEFKKTKSIPTVPCVIIYPTESVKGGNPVLGTPLQMLCTNRERNLSHFYKIEIPLPIVI